MDNLNPGHVDLNERRAAPLARFQDDDAHRASGPALFFEGGEHLALAGVEAQPDVGTAELVADSGAARGPVFEIMAEARVNRFGGAHARSVRHILGNPRFRTQEKRAASRTEASLAGQRVVGGGGESLAAFVFGYYGIYVGHCSEILEIRVSGETLPLIFRRQRARRGVISGSVSGALSSPLTAKRATAREPTSSSPPSP